MENDQGFVPPMPPENEPQSDNVTLKKTVPFEDDTKGFLEGFLETLKLVLIRPSEFFSQYNLEGSIGRPIIFSVIIGWFAVFVSIIWSMIFSVSIFSQIMKYIPDNSQFPKDQFMGQMAFSTFGSIMQLIIAPVIVVIVLFVMAAIYHLLLMMVKGNSKSFESTFNVVAYASGTSVIQLFPVCGGIISWIYGIVVNIIGLTEVHQTDSWKAVFAVLMPIVLCCCCMLVFFFGVFGLAATAGLAASN